VIAVIAYALVAAFRSAPRAPRADPPAGSHAGGQWLRLRLWLWLRLRLRQTEVYFSR
jgi:hypothetical protein